MDAGAGPKFAIPTTGFVDGIDALKDDRDAIVFLNVGNVNADLDDSGNVIFVGFDSQMTNLVAPNVAMFYAPGAAKGDFKSKVHLMVDTTTGALPYNFFGTTHLTNTGLAAIMLGQNTPPATGLFLASVNGLNSLTSIAEMAPNGSSPGISYGPYVTPSFAGGGSGVGSTYYVGNIEAGSGGGGIWTGIGDSARMAIKTGDSLGNGRLAGTVYYLEKQSVNDRGMFAFSDETYDARRNLYREIYVGVDPDMVTAQVVPPGGIAQSADKDLSFAGDSSSFPSGAIPDYEWSFVSGPAGTPVSSKTIRGARVSFRLRDFVETPQAGEYKFKLKVTAGEKTGEKTFTVSFVGNSVCTSAFDSTTCALYGALNFLGIPINANGGGCGETGNQSACDVKGKPVNVGSGSMWDSHTDFVVPGRTPATALRLDRIYVSNAATNGGDFGPNWWHNYETRLEPFSESLAVKRARLLNTKAFSSGDLVWIDEAGGANVFKNQGNDTYASPNGMNVKIQEFADHFELIKRDRVKLIFSKTPFGKLTAITEPHGESVNLSYDGQGKLQSVSTGLAGSISFLRNGAGKVVEVVRDRDNLHYLYSYNSDGRLSSYSDFANATYHYEYIANRPGKNSQGMLSKITDPLNRVLEFTYYDDGRAYQQFEPGGGVTTFQYSPTSTTVIDVDGAKTVYQIDGYQRVASTLLADGTRKPREWGVDGKIAAVKEDHGGVTKFSYDENGNVISLQRAMDPKATVSTFDPAFNKPLSVTPPVGAATTFEVDPNTGDTLKMTRGGLSLSYTYDTFGNRLSVNNGKTTYADLRNSDGLLTRKFDLHNPVTYAYDSRGRVDTESYQSGRMLHYTYDDYDRVTDITDTNGPSTHNEYDVMGRLLQRRVSAGSEVQVTSYQYDVRDRLVSTTDALNRTTTYHYDSVKISDKPISITDPAGRTTYFKYDALQRLTEKTDALGAKTRYTYDQRGNLTSVTDANGNVTKYYFDLNNRKVREVRPSVAGSTAVERVQDFFYDGAGRLVREIMRSATGGTNRVTEYTYNELDRLVRKTLRKSGAVNSLDDESVYAYENQLDAELLNLAQNGVASLSFTNEPAPPFQISSWTNAASQNGNPFGLIEGTFDVARDVTGNIASISRNGSYVFQKVYDLAGRLTSVSVPGALATNLGYDGYGRRISIHHSDGSSGSFQRDLLDRITQVSWTGATPITENLIFDLAGNPTSVSREDGNTWSVGFDAISQIISSVGIENRSWQLDPVGNRLQDSVNGPGVFVSNFLLNNGAASYLADPDGFGDLVKEAKAGVTKNYTYRADGRISGFQSGNLQVVYYYDGLGQIAAKSINDGSNSYTQSFLSLGKEGRLLLGKAGNGEVTIYLDGPAKLDHLGEVKNGVGKGYVTDHLGSVLNSEMAGTSHKFSLFGESSGSAPLSLSSDPASFGFAGGMHNRESKTTRFDWRDLNHDTGRWLSQDPIGHLAGDENYYRYVNNSPLERVDPSGQKILDLTGGLVPPEVKNSAMYKDLDSKTDQVIEIRVDNNLYGIFGQVSTQTPERQIIDINLRLHLGEEGQATSLGDTVMHELYHANTYYYTHNTTEESVNLDHSKINRYLKKNWGETCPIGGVRLQ